MIFGKTDSFQFDQAPKIAGANSECRRILSSLLFLFCFGFLSVGQAMDSVSVLPRGIRSPSFRFGVIGSLDQKYSSDGNLMYLEDLNAVEFDAKALVKVQPRVQQLVDLLNQFGRQELGNKLSMGVLRPHIEPEVRYFAPLFAYGLTNKVTVALGLPIVTYKNHIGLTQYGSNINEIYNQVANLSSTLDDAFRQLTRSLVSSVNDELSSKGYKPLVDRNETFIGDLQIASIYRFYDSLDWSVGLKTFLSLPTGPKDDPDDLADVGAFGETSIEPQIISVYHATKSWDLAAKASYRWTAPDRLVQRVPVNAEDSLPGLDRKENVYRDTGDVVSLGSSTTVKFDRRFSSAVGYEFEHRIEDSYSGNNRGWDYSLLSRGSEMERHRVRFALDYSTVEAYAAKESAIPFVISYEFSDIVKGYNTERRTINELWMMMFF